MNPPVSEKTYFFTVYRAQMQVANELIWQQPERLILYAVLIEALCVQEINEGVLRLEPRKLATNLSLDPEQVLNALRILESLGILMPHPKGWGVCEKLAMNPHLSWHGYADIRNQRIRTARPIGTAHHEVTTAPNVIYIMH